MFEINILIGFGTPARLSAGFLLGAEMGETWGLRGRSGGCLGPSSSDLQANAR